MPVSYEYIDNILTAHGLQNPVLNILISDHLLYRSMLYQHKGDLVATTEDRLFIGNRDQETAAIKHRTFFELAVNQEVDLAVTPEYSCPISVLASGLQDDVFPAEHKLWVVGCESMQPQELRDFMAAGLLSNSVVLAEEAAQQNHENKILDPVAYLFRTRNADGEFRKVVLFQFKTFPMGATPLEAVHLFFGTRRFVFRNDEDSIYLATIICSEAQEIDLQRDLRQFTDKPYLLLHPQMNRGSRTDAFKRYRTDFYNACAKDAEKDIISLNWASGSHVGADILEYGNTAIYTKAEKIITDDVRISQNDQLGLYFNCWAKAYASILVFEQSEAIYVMENSKVSKRALPVQNQGRYGPKMLERYIWEGGWQVMEVGVDAALDAACEAIGADFQSLLGPHLASIDRERLLSLSVGEIANSKWQSPLSSKFFAIANTEESMRLMVYQDPTTQAQKRTWLNRYAALLNQLPADANLIPSDSHMTDMTGDLGIVYTHPDLHYNVVGASGIPACVVYLGDSDPVTVGNLRADLLASAKGDNNYPSRLIILYQHLGMPQKNYQRHGPPINRGNNADPVSIKKQTA